MFESRFAVLAAVILFFALALVWPTLRTYRRTGVWPVTLHRKGNPAQQVIGRAMGLSLAGVLAWSIVHAVTDPAALGLWQTPAWVSWTGWSLLGGSLVLILVAQAQMGASWRIGIDASPTALVTGGLFRVVRNPIFTAMLAMMLGLALVTPSAWTVLGWVYAATVIAIQTRHEEAHLEALHGDAYRAYAARVGRFLPGLGRVT